MASCLSKRVALVSGVRSKREVATMTGTDSDESEAVSPRRRISNRRTIIDDDVDSEQSGSSPAEVTVRSGRKHTEHSDSDASEDQALANDKNPDDEFEPDSSDDDEALEAEGRGVLSESDDDSDARDTRQQRSPIRRPKKRKKIGTVGDDVGIQDESGDEGHSPPRVKRRSALYDEDEDEDELNDVHSPLKCIECESTHDAITAEELPEWETRKHVCFYSPDQQAKQCFCLETLRKIAMTSKKPFYEIDAFGHKKACFLQPPHFRSKMSADLEDQIASRFGRDALDLFGSFYTRAPEKSVQTTLSDNDDGDRFSELFNTYINKCMGNHDLYLCPICYTAAHRMLLSPRNDDEDGEDVDEGLDEEEIFELYTTDYSADPIRILLALEGDYSTASRFSFRKASQVKAHLRKIHGVDTSDIDGNDLYKRFRIRATDGLLQRYLNTGQRRYKKSMQSYWYFGNNIEFVYLLESVTESDGSEIPEAREFWNSFKSVVPTLWRLISDPFRKYNEEVDDFVDDDEDDGFDAGDRSQYRALMNRGFQSESDDDVQEHLKHIQERFREEQDIDLSRRKQGTIDFANDKNELLDTSEEELPAGMVEESSSEEDEWMSKKQRASKRKRKAKPKRSRRSISSPIANGSANSKRRIVYSDSDDN